MLSGSNNCIKILVTTSSEITAELMSTVPPYKLPPLSEDDCWTIFSDKAFGDRNDVNACLKEIGRQIVKRCEGLPALARSLGSIVHNQVMDVWLAVRDEALWKLQKTYSTKMQLFSPFYHIYYDMPSALKLCFLYLSVFPKGSLLDKEKLIQQWVALDMIGSKHETLPSYVHGEMYIEDLLSIHFLQVQKAHSVNEIENKTAPTMLCMHNLVHDFARHIASNDNIILDDGELNSNAKRLTFQYILLTYYRGNSTLCSPLITRARALHFRNTKAIKLHKEAFKLLDHLRVLNLSGSCIGDIPASIGHLKHLRYLDISDLKIQTLPSSMSTLTNLEALVLSNTSLKQLPSSIGTLPKLKYLNLQGCDKLQTLPPTLGHLQRLEHLSLSCCYDVSELSVSLCNLHDLRILDLSSCTEIQQLPPSFGNLMNLEDLNVWLLQSQAATRIFWKLEVLILRRCSRLQNLPPCFQNIQCLRILDLAGCEALHISTEVLTTNLEYLNLQRCRKLQTQPNCFVNFTKLKFLNLSQCHPNIHNLLNLSQGLPNIYYLQSLGYLSKLEYLDLSQTVLDIPVSFERLQKLHTLDLTGCVLIHPSSGVPQILTDMIGKMRGLKFVLTKDPTIVASLPQHIRCSVDIDEQWHIATDELVIPDLSGGSRGLGIAEKVNLQNRSELRFIKLEWMPTSQSAAGDVVEYAGEEEVLEKLQPNHSLEHFELVGYAGSVFPTWMMSNMMSLLPNLVSLHIFHLENCKTLPPLGDIRNLRYLYIKDVPNLTNLDMGLSGGTRPFKKLTHLNLESLFNLEEFSILLPISSEEQFIFPALEELSVVSCCKLIFKPSLPKCLKYEIKESNNVLLCGEPVGPASSSSPVQIEITGSMVPSSLLQWIRSLRTLEKAVIDACVGEDGRVLTSVEFLETMSNEEQSSSYAAHEITAVSPLETIIPPQFTTQIEAPATASTGRGKSIFKHLFQRLGTSPTHKERLASMSINSSTISEDLSTISSNTSFAESSNLSIFTFAKLRFATRNFRSDYLLGEGWCVMVYKGQLQEIMNTSGSGTGMVVAIKRFNRDSYEWMNEHNWQEKMNLLGKDFAPQPC
uniref:Uncharacterized protein n=1 Tax=Avena sativa TaxID=4498 RepID=A0ACD5Y647_AVESA